MVLLRRYSGLNQRMIGGQFGGLARGFDAPRSQSDPGKDRDLTDDPQVVSGSHQAKYSSQDSTLATLRLSQLISAQQDWQDH